MDSPEIQSVKQRFGIIGNSPALNHAIHVALQVAQTDMTVLITGESGTGKESFSKIIHFLSHRKHKQFIAINCGAIPEGTIDSELFGHEKGSFTGATDARKGYFEETNGGSIFLDEIGEMPLGTQSRLLRILENGEFIKVGSSKVQKTDVRVVAATNVKLLEAVENKKFRDDLYYRLNTVPIYVPPLRERGADIELLFKKFAFDFADKYKCKHISLDEEARRELLSFRFPGNIRQLKNLVEQISLLESDNRLITAATLRKYMPQNEVVRTPAIFVPHVEHSFEKEHSKQQDPGLFKLLLEMKAEVTEMKRLVLSMLQGQSSGSQILQNNLHLFSEFDTEFRNAAGLGQERPNIYFENTSIAKTQPLDLDKIQDLAQEVESEDELSIEKNEKSLIIKALVKHGYNRKQSAKELGISERTLYRKIKQYDLEDDKK